MKQPTPFVLREDLNPDTWFRGRGARCSARDLETGGEGYRIPPSALVAVDTALALGEPLLVTGEPGTGKTSLAYHLARRLGVALFHFQTQSSSVARDLRYGFDEVRRFRDAWRARSNPEDATVDRPTAYLERRPLWQAIEWGLAHRRPAVLLIDEIDKAPRDFPNDLLRDLDQMAFDVPELRKTIRLDPKTDGDLRPVVVITSNEERELPRAFVRRCLFLRLTFTKATLQDAIRARAAELGGPSDAFIEVAIRRIFEVRGAARRKQAATGEALMWLRALHLRGVNELDLDQVELGKLPLLELLVKHPADWKEITGRD